MLASEKDKYLNWTKEQLIARVLQLENSELRERKRRLALPDKESKKANKQKKVKEFDFSKHNVRFIALKFAYLGWNYNGLAVQKEPTPLPTVEGTIIDALNKCKLVPPVSPNEYKFSRCGRTDKGVSAMNQVISLNIRSNLTNEQQADPQYDSDEIQYVHILNQLLPDDIRISAVCLRPPSGFDARFSCQHRHYRYFFQKEGLDIPKMEEAAKLYLGENDFRNFCKLDGSKQITNYLRTVMSSKISQLSDDFYYFDLVGSAFLWHQVRCMIAILFLIGQGLEEPKLIIEMLTVDQTPRKPIYDMASEIPLILYDCSFENMDWIRTDLNDYKAVKYGKAASALTSKYQMKAEIAKIFKSVLSVDASLGADLKGKTIVNIGDGKGKVIAKYEKMLDRKVMDTAEEVNEKYRQRKKIKNKGMK